MARSLTAICFAVFFGLSAVSTTVPAYSQGVVVTNPNGLRLYYADYYSPAMAAAYQIRAEAEYLRGWGQMQKDLAETRILNEEFLKLRGENAVQFRINKLRAWEADQALKNKKIRDLLNKPRENNDKRMEQLRTLPETRAGQIQSGGALNFLVNRMAGLPGGLQSGESIPLLEVTPQLVHALRVRQKVGGGNSLIFRLDEGQPIQVDWLPPALRTPALKAERNNFERARNEVFVSKAPEEFDRKIEKLLFAQVELEVAFKMQPQLDARDKSQNVMHDYLEGKRVLESLKREILRLRRLGQVPDTARELTFKGSDLTMLVDHMVRNGLEFVPSRPGDEPAYTQVFTKLLELCVAMEASADEAAPQKAN